jgi:reverse gyrase
MIFNGLNKSSAVVLVGVAEVRTDFWRGFDLPRLVFGIFPAVDFIVTTVTVLSLF